MLDTHVPSAKADEGAKVDVEVRIPQGAGDLEDIGQVDHEWCPFRHEKTQVTVVTGARVDRVGRVA